MKAEEFVKQYYPDARAISSPSCYGEANKHKPTTIKATSSIGLVVNLAHGYSESNAWVNAKKHISGKMAFSIKQT